MKYFCFLFFLVQFLTTCTGRVVNPSSTSDVSQEIFEALMAQDSARSKKFYVDESFAMNPPHFSNLNLVQFKNKGWKIIKKDTLYLEVFQAKIMQLYFKVDSSYHKLSIDYVRDETGNVRIFGWGINDLSLQCSKEITEPYTPRLGYVQFVRMDWSTDSHYTTLKNGSLLVKNNYGKPITYLKFKIVIKLNGQLIYNQTTVTNQTILEGDLVPVDVPGMRNYFVGDEITKDALGWEAWAIEVEPKDFTRCEELKQIKELDQG